MTDTTLLDRFVRRTGELYSLPRVAAQVLELTRDEHLDARALKDCIECDPALTSKVLRVVNSSLFGLAGEVRDLNQALALLGTKPLKLLVLGFSLPDGLCRDLDADFLSRYWQHTLVRAVAARELSRAAWSGAGDEAFLAGLLEDLGLLALAQDLGRPYAALVKRARASAGDLCAAERQALSFDHRQLTTRLLSRWQLPDALVAAAKPPTARGFSALSPTQQALPSILHLAELVAQLLADGMTERLAEIRDTAQSEHGLSADEIDALLADLQAKVQQLADVLSLTLPGERNYADVLSQAHARLVSVAADAAADLACAASVEVGAGVETTELWREVHELAEAVRTRHARWTGEPVRHASAAAGATRTAASKGAAPPPLRVDSDRRPAPASTARKAPASSTAEPRRRAAAEPHDPALATRLAAVAATCRSARASLALLLIQVDRLTEAQLARPQSSELRLLREIQSVCREHDQASVCLESRVGCLAWVLPSGDRRTASAAGRHLLDQVRLREAADDAERLTVSVGVAALDAVPKNFDPADLIASADRCLDAAQLSGGNCLKSIERY
jgi:HD-like signal output (HDOD) protein/GGDEF domain-containing protein